VSLTKPASHQLTRWPCARAWCVRACVRTQRGLQSGAAVDQLMGRRDVQQPDLLPGQPQWLARSSSTVTPSPPAQHLDMTCEQRCKFVCVCASGQS
jgi:hypothetical protein